MASPDPGATGGSLLEVDLDALAANWRLLHGRQSAGSATGAAVKANGYGLGAIPVATRLYREGCRHFFVAHPEEGADIRPHLPDALVIVLHGLAEAPPDFFAAHDLVPALSALAEVEAWNRAATAIGRPLPAILHLDTGINRTGLRPEEARALAAAPDTLRHLNLLYVMTHLVAADSAERDLNPRQVALFGELAAGFPGVPLSIANSSGIFLPGMAGSLNRPGAALYGINPTPGRDNPMQPVATLKARILRLADVPAGEGVGYDHIWTAARPSRIATLPIGYADGYPRRLGNIAEASIAGRLCPVVGRISMDLMTVDVTDCPEARAGDWAELIGPAIPLDRVAKQAGTIPYEILTGLGRRFRRVYRGA